jgi:hypothetical protein
MNSRQIEIGDFLLKLIREKGEANTDDIYFFAKEHFIMDEMQAIQIGLTKSHLLTLGLIKSLGDSEYFFALSNEGQKAATMGIAEWMNQRNGNDFFTEQELKNLHDKIDAILEDISQMKFEIQAGQEIIYDEFDDLKNLPALKKKTWHEVVLGKLLKLVLSNTISVELFHKVYKELTGDEIKLLGE